MLPGDVQTITPRQYSRNSSDIKCWSFESRRGKMHHDKGGKGKIANQPRLVCQKLVLMVPLQRGGRHGGELAVEHGLLVPQHHHVLRRDHRPWETLICKGGGQTSLWLLMQTSRPSSPRRYKRSRCCLYLTVRDRLQAVVSCSMVVFSEMFYAKSTSKFKEMQ